METTLCRTNDIVFNERSRNTKIKINNLKKFTGASIFEIFIDVHVFVEKKYCT